MARVCDDEKACIEYRSNVLYSDIGKTVSRCLNCRVGAVRMTAAYVPDSQDEGQYACPRCGRKVGKPNNHCTSCAAHDRELARDRVAIRCANCGRIIKNSQVRKAEEASYCAACDMKINVDKKRAYNAAKAREYRGEPDVIAPCVGCGADRARPHGGRTRKDGLCCKCGAKKDRKKNVDYSV